MNEQADADVQEQDIPAQDERRRWQSETEFFDAVASRLQARAQPIQEVELERYQRLRRPWFTKEYRLRLLGDLRGKRVLDLACGDGANAVLFAKLGATSVGFDISPRCIDLASHLAEINSVGDRTQFFCSPAETASLPEGYFDVIWGDGVLHHLIPVLDTVLKRAALWAKPGALAVFSEPVCVSATMRRLRSHVPIHTDATPDERPLQGRELDIIRRHIPGLQLRWFNFLGRLNKFVLTDNNFERSSLPRRLLADALSLADRGLLSLPHCCNLGSVVVLSGTFDLP